MVIKKRLPTMGGPHLKKTFKHLLQVEIHSMYRWFSIRYRAVVSLVIPSKKTKEK